MNARDVLDDLLAGRGTDSHFYTAKFRSREAELRGRETLFFYSLRILEESFLRFLALLTSSPLIYLRRVEDLCFDDDLVSFGIRKSLILSKNLF